MDALQYVRIEKLRPTESPAFAPGDPATYAYGELNDSGFSLPVGYNLEGWIHRLPEVGESLVVLRCVRNGIERLGIFCSTPVTQIERGLYWTTNSIYRVQLVQPPAKSGESPNDSD